MKSGTKGSATASRADEVRQRRAQQSQTRAASVTNRVVNPTPSRPVTMRGSNYGTPIHRQASTRARRQYYVTMDQSAGSELRLPALPAIQFGWRLLSALLTVLCLIGLFSVYNSPFFQVQSITVKGLQRVTADDINNALHLDNTSIVEILPQKITETLNTDFPELVSVKVSVTLPNNVTIQASERKPVMAIQKGDQTSWVDAEGILFPSRGDAGPLITIHTEEDLPVIAAKLNGSGAEDSTNASASSKTDNQGNTSEKEASDHQATPTGPVAIDPALLSAAQQLSQKLSPDTKLVYTSQEGLGWIDPQGWQVFVGRNLDNFEEKYAMYQAIAKYLSDSGQKANLVSVENINAPFYRLEQ
jgi:cell division protein FtsQ